MKLLKYFYFFLLFLGLLSISIQTKAFNLYNQSFLSIENFKPYYNSEEIEWLHLLYLKENPTLAIYSKGTDLYQENQTFAEKPELVDSWKVLGGNPILRKKPENLENISKWLDEGIEPQKLTDGITKSSSKQNLINELGTAQSKLHVQVLIKNYDNIPGVAKGRYISNGSALTDKANLPNGWKIDVDLPEGEIKNFAGKIEPLELKQGDKIYRISHANGAGGAYWTRTKPEKLDNVVGGTAVQPEWSNFEYIHEYVVPEGKTIKTWVGKTAKQRVSETVPSNYHLPGGDEQLFIKYIGKQDPDFQSIVKSTKAEW